MRLRAITLFASLLLACGASVQEVQVGLYAAEENACAIQATSFDGGLACIAAIQAAHCGPGGIWADAGVCAPKDGDK